MATTTATTLEHGLPPSKYLCLTILGYRKPGMTEEAYRQHMIQVSAPMTKDLMVKYGVKRWTVVCRQHSAFAESIMVIEHTCRSITPFRLAY